MKLAHNIVTELPNIHKAHVLANYNTVPEIEACLEPIGLDGIYLNVYENREVLKGKEVILFVMGDYVGSDNSFDVGMPFEKYCNWKQLNELEEMGHEIGWHTWSHPDLTKVDDERLKKEVTPPFPMESFAYPYGRWDERVVEAVKEAGFKRAYSVFKTNGTEFTIPRSYI